MVIEHVEILIEINQVNHFWVFFVFLNKVNLTMLGLLYLFINMVDFYLYVCP